MMKISIHIDRNGINAPSDSEFQNWVATALQGSHTRADIPNSPELSIQLVTGQEMCRLNMQYRDKPGDTNVLSFPVEPALQAQTGLLGDIIICAEVVCREAAEQAKPDAHHWAHMTIHGTLHLLGYDHIEEADAAIMETLEVAQLASLAIPNPYHA
tara:strand:- start:420 stop:887 length:468 start_codon:yes stop_codon:yes gene_type:complete